MIVASAALALGQDRGDGGRHGAELPSIGDARGARPAQQDDWRGFDGLHQLDAELLVGADISPSHRYAAHFELYYDV